MNNKEQKWRLEGMSWALKIAKEQGIDELEKDLKMRGAYNIPVGLPRSALKEFADNVKDQTLDSVLILGAITLHDEFGFGKSRIERYVKRFNEKADCIMTDYCSWLDNIKILQEECDIHLTIRQNDKDVRF